MKEKYMKDFNGEKIFSLEYDKETLRDMVLDKQEKIERLNNIIKEVRELTEMLYKNEANIIYKGIYKRQLEILDKVGSDKE